MWLRLCPLLGASAVLLLAAVPAPAAVVTVGSSLQGPATVVDAHQADTAFWPTALPGGAPVASPVEGQVRTVRLKGIAHAAPIPGVSGGETMWHLQALRAEAGGGMRVLRSSEAFFVPTTGDPQQITSYAPTDFCIDPGDVLAFNTVGGWDGVIDRSGLYPNGTPLQIFGRTPGAHLALFEGADRTNNGDLLTPSAGRMADRELLLQADIGSGPDAAGHCGGTPLGRDGLPINAPRPVRAQKVTIPARQRVTVSKQGKLSISLFCLPGTGPCVGTVRVLSKQRRPRSLGTKRFVIAPKSSGKATFTLNRTGRKLFSAKRTRLPVRIEVVTAPGGAQRTSLLDVSLRRRGR